MNGVIFKKAMIIVLALFSYMNVFNAQQVNGESKLTRKQQEKKDRTEWFYKAKYGIMFHFVPSMNRFKQIPCWTSDKWNNHVDAVDVKKVAQQAEEIGAGYVIISIGQKGDYYCSPNPAYQKYWGFEDGQFNSKRDLPLDLYNELTKYGIKLMIYITAAPFASPGEASEKNGWYGEGREYDRKYDRSKTTPEGKRIWLECLQWYSEHYGEAVSGWWVDGLKLGLEVKGYSVQSKKLKGYSEGYDKELFDALRHDNSKAIITSGVFELSGFLHGHCSGRWEEQQKRLPTHGRLDEEWGIQWHAFQFLGRSWGAKGIAHTTESIVNYATEVIKRGGVITFDIGTFEEELFIKGPTLEIPEDQFMQLKAVQKALEKMDVD